MPEKNKKGHLYLIGFMGSGKSAVSLHLTHVYGMPRVEMDREIESAEGRTIAEIFQANGETYFRQMETHLLQKIAERDQLLVSCGGGTPLREENVAIMRASGRIVYLQTETETILSRVASSEQRPLLEGHKTVEDIRTMLQARTAVYEAAADHTVVTDEKNIAEVAEEVMEFWRTA